MAMGHTWYTKLRIIEVGISDLGLMIGGKDYGLGIPCLGFRIQDLVFMV